MVMYDNFNSDPKGSNQGGHFGTKIPIARTVDVTGF